ncbi:four-carbon acid sugar kinase family protein [Alkalicoccobacillus porphyridii]|uniref:Four-carbon acid sugar kinase family protein n=1 Tax=Alkalicoccobacillus porphyridii TaxID=2597270 RepID=A0A554A3X0_9BACI|nr:four-carbon acid sugar kinase family protein [Alkalicoccobacillus porphyridii]TSB48394.1 hypothetical protein FN960_02240 [Alkalicoccobacillus porphyridii]
MKIAVIADDLTGANDCGVQLVKFDLEVSVMIDANGQPEQDQEVCIYNSDSRALKPEVAYQKVKDISEQIIQSEPSIIYKKMDSTMRGNVGSELNALVDVFPCDFVFIAPSYPDQGRQIIQGIHYVHGVKLAETEFAKDPKTPVTESYIPQLVETQTEKKVGLLSRQDLQLGTDHVQAKLAEWKAEGTVYIVCDSITENDLRELVEQATTWSGTVLWAGSAGLMNHLPQSIRFDKHAPSKKLPSGDSNVFYVVGSVSGAGRKQLQLLLKETDVTPIELNSFDLVAGPMLKKLELKRAQEAIEQAFQSNQRIAFFSNNDVQRTQEIGRQNGLTEIEVSEVVSEALGQVAAAILKKQDIQLAFLTGGDTAFAIMQELGASTFYLVEELEPGVPVGQIDQTTDLFVITKAGNFGTEQVMVKALNLFEGERV